MLSLSHGKTALGQGIPLIASLGKCGARQQRGRDPASSPEHAGPLPPALHLSQPLFASMVSLVVSRPKNSSSNLSRFFPCIIPRHLIRRIGNLTMLEQEHQKVQRRPLPYLVLHHCTPAPLSKGPTIALPITRVINSKP